MIQTKNQHWIDQSDLIFNLFKRLYNEFNSPIINSNRIESDQFEIPLDSNQSDSKYSFLSYEGFIKKIIRLTNYNNDRLLEVLFQSWIEGYFSFSKKTTKIKIRNLHADQFHKVFPLKSIQDDLDFVANYHQFKGLSEVLDYKGNFDALFIFQFCNVCYTDSKIAELFLNPKLELSTKVIFIKSIVYFLGEGKMDWINSHYFKREFSTKTYFRFLNDLKSKTHPLLKENYWICLNDGFNFSSRINLSPNVIKILFDFKDYENLEENFEVKPSDYKLKFPSEICSNELFFNEVTEKSVNRLNLILKNVPFENLNKVFCLFEGSSGSGKSELAQQIFKELNIPFIHLTGSLQNKFVGETERAIRQLFNVDYPNYLKKYGKVGLLIDEFDLIGSRKTEVNNSSDTHANTIISQLLNCFDGIKNGLIICTINQSKDIIEPSLLRRFKFSINFSRPDKFTRQKIWQSKGLNQFITPEILEISFTGADIQNIAEKHNLFSFLEEKKREEIFCELIEEQKIISESSKYNYDFEDHKIGFFS